MKKLLGYVRAHGFSLRIFSKATNIMPFSRKLCFCRGLLSSWRVHQELSTSCWANIRWVWMPWCLQVQWRLQLDDLQYRLGCMLAFSQLHGCRPPRVPRMSDCTKRWQVAHFCLRPLVKDQGITWVVVVVVVLVLVLVLCLLVHFVIKRNLREKQFSPAGILTWDLQFHSLVLCQLS